jgi:phytoene synthase
MSSLGSLVRKSQASLFWCLRGLPKAQREAVYALYAFCRHIENIADGDLPQAQKKQILETWEQELDNIYVKKVPASDIGRKIYKHCMRFKIRKEDFCAILKSAMTDFTHPLQAPDMRTFQQYVKGEAHMPVYITLQIMGDEDEEKCRALAQNYGDAMFWTTVLKDIKEDAQAGHLYIPKNMLKSAAIDATDPMSVLTDARLVDVREKIGRQAEENFSKAFELLETIKPSHTRPLRFILNIYKCYFDKMKTRGWEIMSPKPEIGKKEKLAMAWKVLFDQK